MKKVKMVGQVLTKAEQKSVLGGAAMSSIYYGACYVEHGCWEYPAGVDENTCRADIAQLCPSQHGWCKSYNIC